SHYELSRYTGKHCQCILDDDKRNGFTSGCHCWHRNGGNPTCFVVKRSIASSDGLCTLKTKRTWKGESNRGSLSKWTKCTGYRGSDLNRHFFDYAANALQDEGMNVLGVCAIFTYGLKEGQRQFDEAGFEHYTLLSFDD